MNVQIKICGLTDPDHAAECFELGADAIGLVFYPPSPRFVIDDLALEICQALPKKAPKVGVFVNDTYEFIMNKAEKCGITMAQLHGHESQELADRLEKAGIGVIKAFFANRSPDFKAMTEYSAKACLVECAGEKLPGGNAKAWAWRTARGISERMPLALAGGLDPENVSQAILDAMPDALDVSSGVEASPGVKDMDKVKRFIQNATQTGIDYQPRKVFS
ncbi:phosphoribosylanthranilate isomerase [Desulfatibacillum alkenivorans DSM 16219]|uniref:N-(5'-phosphoribosyl)anthranilate isomerase n=1 Tax=Desulfatibacillum alkenivorans DSM 16219 TaxID=1121393 RepID=A0A1M6LYQ0_9BACT|nr:phosphoribosylanthranilate isomerase [Desulfatibacillum alkenivorans]SHJ76357.1 phosphoribosylanthranilate isomerase [Desulfatibacillum alkenivorans DSM 16219]